MKGCLAKGRGIIPSEKWVYSTSGYFKRVFLVFLRVTSFSLSLLKAV